MNKKPGYNHREIEGKWQKFWEKNKSFKVDFDSSLPKYYVLDMFPYPSGAGLHVGHVAGYTATDIVARHKKQKGFNVLHPMGFDSFGLPAEQYAIRTGTHPAQTTKENIENFTKQLKKLGYAYDWDRELLTSDPTYYKWTQWIFTKLYEQGLAYEAEMLVNYCPKLRTVLANEEVENGFSVEGGHPVERRPLKQWMLKITAYAEKLLEGLEGLDWPESLKKAQRNWIGKSTGANVTFQAKDGEFAFEIYTTRPDTLFGVTFMVISPEHPLTDKITTPMQHEAVQAYKREAASKSDLQRTDLEKDKTGVFTGSYVVNPITGEEVPVWVADYVLMGYGTGAIMAVPAHDERDFAFAKKYGIPVTAVYTPDIEEDDPLLAEGMTKEEIRKEVLAGNLCRYGEGVMRSFSEARVDFEGKSSQDARKEIVAFLEKEKLGSFATNYKLRDWLFSRQRYWGEPIPILKYEDGSMRALDLDELPLIPPEISDYKPAESGESPLAKVKEFVELIDPKTGKKALRETNTMPQWAGSCWYYLRFCDPANKEAAWNQEVEKYWMNVDLYIGGAEHAVLHLLYARFWHKVLYDLKLVSTPEPFQKLRNQGLITSRSYKGKDGYVAEEEVRQEEKDYFHKETGEKLFSQVEKMSKSKLNGVSPDEIVEELGADSLRLYEMFMGPLEKEKVWSTEAVSGCRRFLTRFYDLVVSEKVVDEESEEANKLAHRLADKVGRDIETLSFNTAIAKMMEFINAFSKLEKFPKNALKMAVICLSPFAPHISEEMWEILGGEGGVLKASFPQVDSKYLEDAVVTYVVQVNGKLRGKFDLPKDADEGTILEKAKVHPTIEKYVDGKEIAKVIFVPNKLLNLVVK